MKEDDKFNSLCGKDSSLVGLEKVKVTYEDGTIADDFIPNILALKEFKPLFLLKGYEESGPEEKAALEEEYFQKLHNEYVCSLDFCIGMLKKFVSPFDFAKIIEDHILKNQDRVIHDPLTLIFDALKEGKLVSFVFYIRTDLGTQSDIGITLQLGSERKVFEEFIRKGN